MNETAGLARVLSAIVILATTLSSVQLPVAAAQGKDGINRKLNAETGKVSFIGPESGRSLTFSEAMGLLPGASRPGDPAMVLAKHFAPEFGIHDASKELSVMKTEHPGNGRVTVRYQQKYQGIPVMGGELIVNTNDNGDLYSINGEASPNLSLSTQPAIDAAQAKQIALEAMAKWNEKTTEDFVATEPELWIFDESLLQPSIRPVELVWRMDVTSANNSLPIRELMLINAQTGNPDFHFNQIDTAWNLKGSAGLIDNPDPTPTALPTETPIATETPIPTPTTHGKDSSSVFSASSSGEATVLSGTPRYVDVATGNDSNPCTQAAPCASIQKAINNAAAADIIFVAGGTYYRPGSLNVNPNVVIVNKGLTISGGWKNDFTEQSGISIVDGEYSVSGSYKNNNGFLVTAGPSIIDHFIIQNSTSSDSGGVYLSNSSLTIKNTSIIHNHAGRGAGIFIISSATLTIQNSTISGNSAGSGAGIYVASGTLAINNTTIAYNISTSSGGGIQRSSGSVSIKNSILAKNVASVSGSDCFGSLDSSDHNIIENVSACTVTAGGGDQFNVDAQIESSLSGMSQLHKLLSTSPAIDTGDNNTCLPADQRNIARPQGTTCDKGAYEFVTTASINSFSGGEQSAYTSTAFDQPFVVYVVDPAGNPVEGITVNFIAPDSGASGTFVSTGTNTADAVSNANGFASAPTFIANSEAGIYTVTAAAQGYVSAGFRLINTLAGDSRLYVSPSGLEGNSCKSASAPCPTIDSALQRVASGGIIYVAEGNYPNPSLIWIKKSIILSGGWNAASFTSQNGYSVIDGQNVNVNVYIDANIEVEMERFTIQNGRGNISAGGLINRGNLIMRKITIKSNYGGGIGNYGTLTLSKSAVTKNSFSGIVNNGTMSVDNTTVSGNLDGHSGAGLGGSGIRNIGILSLNNVTISGNSANGGGGGVDNYGTLDLNNVTISHNFASVGGGIHVGGGAVSVKNSIVSDNIVTSSKPDCSGTVISDGHNILGDTTGCTISSITGDRFNIDPEIGPFIELNGYHALASTSPAIDAGDNATCFGNSDQRGQPRVDGPDPDSVITCDIGSYEYSAPGVPASILALSGMSQYSLPGTAFSQPLKAIILDNQGAPVTAGIEVTFTVPVSGPSGTFLNGASSTSVFTDKFGVATAPQFTANGIFGPYHVSATANGLLSVSEFALDNAGWYVSLLGSDLNNCKYPGTACRTIRATYNKAGPDETIFIATGTYTDVGSSVLTIDKNMLLSGGWDIGFTVQNGFSVLDGQNTRNGIVVDEYVNTNLENIAIQHTTNGLVNYGVVTVANCLISQNSATGVSNYGTIALDECMVAMNLSGGVYNRGELTLSNSTVSRNTATSGAGIYNTTANGIGIARIDHTIISNNQSSEIGGGIMNNGTMHISSSSISNNSAGFIGGGMYNAGMGTLENVSIVGNEAAQGGGIQDSSSNLELTNLTISANIAAQGGGIYVPQNGKNTNLKNTIISKNIAQNSGPNCYGDLISLGHNIISDTTSCNVGSSNGDLFGIDPILGAFLPSEGYVPLRPGSPAINAGDSFNCPETDQRGILRHQDIMCDIGAYEYTVPGPLERLVLVNGDNQLTPIHESFRKPLQVGALDNNGSPISGVSVSFQAPFSSPSGIFADTDTSYNSVITNSGGIAEAAPFTADDTIGSYDVVASATGASAVDISVHNGAWLIKPMSDGGNDSNDCLYPESACASLSGVLSKNSFQDGDPVWMAIGTYGNPSDQAVITITTPVNIYGGWSLGFTNQFGTSDIQDSLRFATKVDVSVDRLTVQSTNLIGIRNVAKLLIKNSTIRDNSIAGIENDGDLTLINSTVTHNGYSATGMGRGGIYTVGANLPNGISILNSTITDNKGEAGGVGGDGIKIQNTIIAKNLGAYGSPDCAASFVSYGNNLIGNIGSNRAPNCNGTWQDSDIVGYKLYDEEGHFIEDKSVDPMLDPLQDLGNNTWVYPLQLGSPAINGGGAFNCPPTDQRGVTRPQGGKCDIGAYEYVFNSDPNNLMLRTFDAGSTWDLPGALICDQTDLSCTLGDQQAKNAHLLAAEVYGFYKDKFARKSIDNRGLELISVVHYGSDYQNAFWNSYMMIYGDGYDFANADDIVAHELTHGVTQNESNLLYFYQSGAIDESLSDVFGEYFDQTNGQGNDDASVKWLIGEDVTGSVAFRSMKNPPQFGDPDKMTSPLYNKKPYYDAYWDNGGVHSNSGVNNKAAFLMVDGGTFNGKTVTALGWEKTGAIYYEVNTNLLSAGSDYSDLYYAVQQACTNLIGQHGITSADCLEVKDAVDAVQMNSEPAVGFNPDASLCPTGMTTADSLSLFKDDFEHGVGNWTTSGDWSLDEIFASSPIHHMLGVDDASFAIGILTNTTGISLPAGSTPFLHFKHAFAFEHEGSNYYDGAVLEYSTNNGNTWLDAKPLFSGGQNYKASIFKYPAGYTQYGSALQGRPGFVGDSHGYVSSRYDLKTLAGKTVQFRWYFSADVSYDYYGWFVDDVQVYSCVGTPSVPVLKLPANNSLTTNYTPLLDWADATPSADHYQVQVDDNADFSSPIVDVNNLNASQYPVASALTDNTKYYWRVRSFNAVDGTNGWSVVWIFRTAMLPPVLSSPTDAFASKELRPLFDWDDVPTATGYTIQIARDALFKQIVHTGNPIGSSYVPTVDLPKGGILLYWRVLTKGDNGPSLYSGYRSLTTPSTPPPAPALSLPASNALVTNYKPTFTWKAVLPPAGTFLQNYLIQVDDSATFNSPEVNDTASNPTFTPSTDLDSNRKFYWRVRAVNTLGEMSNWSTVWYFRTAILPPILNLPVNDATSVSKMPLLDWSDVVGNTGYTLQIWKTGPTPTLVKTVTLIPNASQYQFVTALLPNTSYFWKVQTKATNGPSTWSEDFDFTTGP